MRVLLLCGGSAHAVALRAQVTDARRMAEQRKLFVLCVGYVRQWVRAHRAETDQVKAEAEIVDMQYEEEKESVDKLKHKVRTAKRRLFIHQAPAKKRELEEKLEEIVQSAEEHKCDICDGESPMKDLKRLVCCHHMFHKDCIKEHLKDAWSCPCCDAQVPHGAMKDVLVNAERPVSDEMEEE